MPTLRSNLSAAAASFADSVLDAIRSASLEELLAESTGGGGRRGQSRPRGGTTAGARLAHAKSARPRNALPRSAVSDATWEKIVGLVGR
jgi:hypothetical protein